MKTQNCIVQLTNIKANINLFFFPFAGGTSQSYRSLVKSGKIVGCNMYALELPGRGLRMNDNYSLSVEEIKNECILALQPFLNDPMIFVGHSMGSIIAYELLCAVKALNDASQAALIVSAANSPRHLTVKDHVFNMSLSEFRTYVKSMGGVPEAISENDQLLDFFLPRIYNDMKLLQTYKPNDKAILNTPITAIAPTDDNNVKPEYVLDWGNFTNNHFEINWCEGGHFYLFDEMTILTNVINQVLQEYLQC